MGYDEMIYGLADEMLEKIAADDDYGYDDGYYYDDGYEDYDDYDGITEEDLDYMDDDELEALAEAMYEGELEKTAGQKWNAVKAAPGRAWKAIKGYPGTLTGKKARNWTKTMNNAEDAYEQARKNMIRYEGTGTPGKPNPRLEKLTNDHVNTMSRMQKARRKERLKTGAAWAGTAGAAGAGAYGVHRLRNKGQEKAAQMYEEAQLYKQAAEETWEEAQMVQDAASVVFDYLEY